jgi:hypothetical protein
MALNEVTAADRSTGNGSTTVFPYTFEIASENDIEVLVNLTVQTLTTDYTVDGVGNSGGGTITFVTAPANGTTVTRLRKQPASQLSTYTANEAFPHTRVENDFDKLWMAIQQLREQVSRAVSAPKSDAAISALPIVSQRASKYSAFDSSGNPIAVDATSASGTTVTASGSTAARLLADRFADWVNVKDFGAIGNGTADDTTAINNAIAAISSTGGVVYFPRGVYRTVSTITLTTTGTRLIGEGCAGLGNATTDAAGVVGTGTVGGATRIVGDFTAGAVIHIQIDHCAIIGMTIDGSATRKAAAMTTTNVGIRIEAPDTLNAYASRFLLQNLRVCNQPSHGYLIVNGIVCSRVDMCHADHVNGHGLFIAGGAYTGRTNKIQPGQVEIWNFRASRTGGHAVKVGGTDAEVGNSDIPYRVHIYNLETFYNCITPTICEQYVSASTDVSNVFLSGDNHMLFGSAVDGRVDRLTEQSVHKGLTLRGRFIDVLNCRFIDCNPNAIHIIAHPLMSSLTKSIQVTQPLISAVLSPGSGAGFYNPAILYGSDAIGVRVISQNLFSNTAKLSSRTENTRYYELSDGNEFYDFLRTTHKNLGDTFKWANIEYSLADDRAAYIDMGAVTRGIAIFSANASTGGSAIVHFRVGDGNALCNKLASTGPTVTTGTGTLAGTTGTDTHLTIRADTATPRLYFENRLGSSVSYTFTFLSVTQVTETLFTGPTLV